jgi:Phage terminase, small subunit
MVERKLTAKQEAFVKAYLQNGRNAAAAYRTAYDAAKMSDAAVQVEACKLLKHPSVALRVEAVVERAAERTEVTVERTIAELVRMAFYDPADIAGKPISGPKDIASLPEDVRRAIIGWGWDRNGNFTVKLADKRGALDLIGRHLGAWTDKLEVSGTISLADRLAAARKRVNGDGDGP